MDSNKLRQLAAVLRKEASAQETVKMVKCAQVLQAARALDILKEKVRHAR